MKKIIDLHNEIKKSLISIQVLEMRFNKILDEIFNIDYIHGDWILDVGTGPCLHTSFFSSRKFKNIIF